MSNEEDVEPKKFKQIDDLLKDLENKDGEIEIVEEKLKDEKKEQEALDKTLKGEEKKKQKKRKVKIINKLEMEKDELEKEKTKMRKQLAKLEKQAGKETNKVAGKGSSAKAVGTGGGNKDGVRCYIRYNNAGNPYRICNDKKGKEPRKPKSKITPPMDASEFAEKYGGYSNLSKEQERTYHRLYMAAMREEERKLEDGGEEFKQLVSATKQKKKEVKRLEKLEKEKQKIERKQNRKKYKEALDKLVPKDRKNPSIRKSLQEKYGVTPKQDKTIKEISDEEKLLKANIKALEEQESQATKELKSKVEDVELFFN